MSAQSRAVKFSTATNAEALPRALGNRAFISGEQGNKGKILRGTGEQRQYWGTGNIRKQIFGEQGNKPIYFRGAKEQVPPLEGLNAGGCLLTFNIEMMHFKSENVCKVPNNIIK